MIDRNIEELPPINDQWPDKIFSQPVSAVLNALHFFPEQKTETKKPLKYSTISGA
ncbi:hypothetical protein [Pseudomonas sp. B707]|jgi:hypothetical protein|uniref:hypothetical protein n=1 Tax=Pseudomonas sp. B707 TaxID=2689570 RepID=UPI001F0ED490|nr:hypothetical protein [Pseudomonas sp. B707]MCH4901059.1 hypothetical protein [Pseudomonas sp. B707]